MGVRYPLLSYFEISLMIYLSTFNSYLILCDYIKIDTDISELDIKNKVIKDSELLIKQYNLRTTENFENYYKQNQNN